ncbi:MAG: hypothetical protein L7U72_10935 [Rubripirellula sp.]|nr:hypothetical protein [Rubripirellula sp.]
MTVSNPTPVAEQSDIVTIDRRRGDRRLGEASESTSNQPAKKQRRRHIDPTTCERDYSGDEIEFMRAMDDYKRASGRMFPTCSEVLEVIRSLGYYRLADDQVDQLGLTFDTQDDEQMVDGVEEEFESELAEIER